MQKSSVILNTALAAIVTLFFLGPVQAPAETATESSEKAARQARCDADARRVAAQLGTSVKGYGGAGIDLGTISEADISIECPDLGFPNSGLQVLWTGSARPMPSVLTVLLKGGPFLTGIASEDLEREVAACFDEALKPNAFPPIEREFQGVMIECAGSEATSAGRVTLFRKTGTSPKRPEPSASRETAEQIKQRDEERRRVLDAGFTPEAISALKGFADIKQVVAALGAPTEENHDPDRPMTGYYWVNTHGHAVASCLVDQQGFTVCDIAMPSGAKVTANNRGAFFCPECDPPMRICGSFLHGGDRSSCDD